MTLIAVACASKQDNPNVDNTSNASETTKEPAAAGGESADKIVLELWKHAGTEAESIFYDKMIDNFNKSQDKIEIKATTLPNESYHDQMRAAALTGGLPHILDIDFTEMPYMAYQGFLNPLENYLTPELKDDMLPSVLEEGTYDGKQYFIGQFESGMSFWANKSYLEKAGVRIPTSVNDAWSKEEFEDALAKLQELPEVEYALDVSVARGEGWWIYSYLPWVKGFGGDFENKETHLADGVLNSEATVNAFKYLQDLINQGYVNKVQTTKDDFHGSKISALMLVGHWMGPAHEESLGDDAILIPFPDFGNGVYTTGGSWGWTMTSRAEEEDVTEAAWEALEYFMSAENVKGISEANGAIPSRISVLDSMDQYKPGGKYYLYREQLELGHAWPRPLTPAFSTFQKSIGAATMNMILGADVQKELDEAAKNIDQTIKDAGYFE
ncbi:ABC transporter substrate-binding protein [Paenibacillus harenae]|uniref:ABC transporter substrate-binding protein n=1 Tax=Paenibacillus harenae TaxID=306543 RepID=UPI0012EB9BCD|nr:sugar ABC transporter substrate-binding protein [Paenibacillus harenae]